MSNSSKPPAEWITLWIWRPWTKLMNIMPMRLPQLPMDFPKIVEVTHSHQGHKHCRCMSYHGCGYHEHWNELFEWLQWEKFEGPCGILYIAPHCLWQNAVDTFHQPQLPVNRNTCLWRRLYSTDLWQRYWQEKKSDQDNSVSSEVLCYDMVDVIWSESELILWWNNEVEMLLITNRDC